MRKYYNGKLIDDMSLSEVAAEIENLKSELKEELKPTPLWVVIGLVKLILLFRRGVK